MATEADCLATLRAAAQELGESPTKAPYEALGLTPAASTVLRVCGGWNEAKEAAGLETNPSTGSRVTPQPDDVSLPEGTAWADLSQDQRWHYRNVEHNTERTLLRRQRLREWVNERKRERGCATCEVSDPRCLDFHHTDPGEKRRSIGELVTYGHGRESLRTEMEKCEVRCANCHHREHSGENRWTDLREWVHERKRQDGCARCGRSDPACLVFHHTDEKLTTVAEMVSAGKSREAIAEEMGRCVVLCANCHRKQHVDRPKVDNGTET